jgi:CheY-like chemotaxis protein
MSVVLVVEDDGELLAILRELLGDEGWTVLTASSAEAAVAVAASASSLDVVLCDLVLPVMGGIELRRSFQGDGSLAGVPFVFMSGRSCSVGHLDGAPVLAKPFRLAELSRVLAAMAIHRAEADQRCAG